MTVAGRVVSLLPGKLPHENTNMGLWGLYSSTSNRTASENLSCGAYEDTAYSGDVKTGTRQARSESSGSAAACSRLVVPTSLEEDTAPTQTRFAKGGFQEAFLRSIFPTFHHLWEMDNNENVWKGPSPRFRAILNANDHFGIRN